MVARSHFHVGKLLHCRETGEIDPRGIVTMAMVVPLLLQPTERVSSKSMEFEGILLSFLIGNNIDVCMYVFTKMNTH